MASEHTVLESRLELFLSWLLRVGVIVCAIVILGGLTVSLLHLSGHPSTISALVKGEVLPNASVAHSLSDVAAGIGNGSGRAWIVVGLMLLIALPPLRVFLASILFGIERDWLYVGLTSLVLILLLSGLLLGKAL